MKPAHSAPLHVAVCIATYQRPQLLRALLESLAAMQIPPSVRVLELRIVDNDKSRSATATVEPFACACKEPVKLTLLCEPRQNIAHARNAAINSGPADCFIFIDDDERVCPLWLTHLIDTYTNVTCDAIFGPVLGVFASQVPPDPALLPFFQKPVPPTGTRLGWKQTRTSNTLVCGKWFTQEPHLRFEAAYGRSGGSDTHLFRQMEALGAVFIACEEAEVSETVPAERAQLRWLLRRYYRNGTVFERICQEDPTAPHPALRCARRLGTSTIGLAKATVPLLQGQRGPALAALLKLPLAAGGLVAWLWPEKGQAYVEYQSQNQESPPHAD